MVVGGAQCANKKNNDAAKGQEENKGSAPAVQYIIVPGKPKGTPPSSEDATMAEAAPMAPKIYIPQVHISDMLLTKVTSLMQKKKPTSTPARTVILSAWMHYDLDYSRQHSPVKPSDIRECLAAGLQHKDVPAKVHAVRTRDTKADGKGFKTKYDIWLAPSQPIAEDKYLVPRFLALDATIHNMVQAKSWKDFSNNEHAGKLRVTFPSNNSTVVTPEFMVSGFAADTHGTAHRQHRHIAEAI